MKVSGGEMVERIEFEQAWKGMSWCRIAFLECVLYFGALMGVASLFIAAQLIALNQELFLTYFIYHCMGGRSSSVGVAPRYGLDGSGFETQ